MGHSVIQGSEIMKRLRFEDAEFDRLGRAQQEETPVSLPDRDGMWLVTHMDLSAGPGGRRDAIFTLARVKS
jgi:hypothetical protein